MTVEVDTFKHYANSGVSISFSKQQQLSSPSTSHNGSTPATTTSYQIEESVRAADFTSQSDNNNNNNNVIAISPYSEPGHLLDLSSLEAPSQYLARALTHLKALRPDYATAPYLDTFNWGEVVRIVQQLAEQDGYTPELRAEPENGSAANTTTKTHISGPKEWSFYIVAFRSRVPVGTDRTEIYQLDAIAHREAMERGGLLKYWYGVPDVNGRNLATCLWRSRADAKRGGSGPGHQRAMRVTMRHYTEWDLERYRLRITPQVPAPAPAADSTPDGEPKTKLTWKWDVSKWHDHEEE
ncbi:hypothetical protein L228DRAFT_268763 [Xylona heveae TC161]|uniref:Uncharacterized protein n=1 Tax=Xylona heveae (strain CBS 132557 / TC161) TaxID=1328760 RepID=A0A165GK10_XYLHT|nr:hypothetical protein L228DRAFT_268763 [Xylona heveae TC161]KZF22287.1 hypothetical protein L228DRAFT_268763 [Xylona heveae TC161]